jgi:transposase
MFKTKDVLRMHFEAQLSRRQIARALSLSRAGVQTTIERAEKAGLTWPLPEEMTDAALESCLYPAPTSVTGRPPIPLPDWTEVRRELSNKHVTRRILWEEYRASHSDGIGYSQYCDRYRQWLRHLDPVMRIDRKAGEKLFVDWSGDPAEFIDPETGEVRQAPLFVAVLGTSSYLYAEATRTEQLHDWVMAHVRALTALGGAPPILVPDNTKTAVTKPCYYEPTLNRTYAEMAAHYGMAILPARVRRPKDKPTSESGVLLAQRAILGRLRKRQFFSLAQLNEAIAEQIDAINQAPFQKLEGSRQSHFDEVDLPALRPLPQTPYEFAEWLRPRAGVNYHIQVEKHFYSVPHRLIRRQVTVRLTGSTLEVFYEDERVASHRRSFRKYGYTTVAEHMPSNHRLYTEWNPERILKWAATAGESVAELCGQIMRSRPHPEQGFRACLGIMRLAKLYDKKRTEAACKRALAAQTVSYKSVESILKNGLDGHPLCDTETPDSLPDHEHVRGADFFH